MLIFGMIQTYTGYTHLWSKQYEDTELQQCCDTQNNTNSNIDHCDVSNDDQI